MFKNYLKLAFRNLWNNKFYSGINIIGLAIGIAAVILILLYLQYESSFDQFHKNGENIYRVLANVKWEGREEGSTTRFLAPVGPTIKADYPEVQDFLRLRGPRTEYFYHQAKPVKIENILHADSSFFSMLSFELLSGDKERALVDPYSIILNQTTAFRIFGTDDIIGQTLEAGSGEQYAITAVAKDHPVYSSIKFDMLISFSTLYQQPQMYMGWNGGNQYITYLQLYPNADAKQLEAKLPAMIETYLGEHSKSLKYRLSLQPFKKLHLFYDPGQLFLQILLFGAIAVLILIVAGINFINLSLAQSMKRAKEIAVRKVAGAERASLIGQLLIESATSSFLATTWAVLIVTSVFPFYKQLVGADVPGLTIQFSHIAGLLSIALIVGLIAGSVPAFYLASLLPIQILKNSLFAGRRKNGFRNALVIFQFAVSILLIICTLIIFQQQTFMKNKALGFNKDNILVLNLPTDDLQSKNEVIKTSLLELPEIQSATLCSDIPYRGFGANGYLPEGFDTFKIMWIVYGDSDFMSTFDIQLIDGRHFDPSMATDKDAYIVNEQLARSLGWENPIGKRIQRGGIWHPIIGVVKDFHYSPMNQNIEPMIISSTPEYGGFFFLALKVASDNISNTVKEIEKKVADITPAAPFEFWFLDASFDTLYRFEERLNILFMCFAGLAILIALLGLYSLVTISIEYKTKQIGIRKVLGSSVFGITRVVSREFLWPVVLSNVIAWPIAWYIAIRWLQTFAYKISLSWWLFLGAGILTFVIALITLSVQSIKAATANPVEALRYE